MPRAAFLLVFAVSGAAALVYEVTWTRLLTLQLGHGVAAASTVLAAFMGGLAAGSAVGGRVGARLEPTRALIVYAGLELLIGLLALLLPWELSALQPLFVHAYADGAGGPMFAGLRLASSLLLVSLPAAAMGATFPIASRWRVRHASRAAAEAGDLYAANTVGAALGAVVAGFVLLPQLGLSATTWVGVLLNVVAAGGALWIARAAMPDVAEVHAAEATGAEAKASAVRPTRGRGRRRKEGRGFSRSVPNLGPHVEGRPWLAAIALGLSGFCSLTLQVVWTRLLALILGPTIYAFSVIVCVFIAGIAVGSMIAARLANRTRQPLLGLVLCLVASGGLALAATAAVDWSLLAMARTVARPDAQFGDVLLRQVAIVGALLLPMTVAFGGAFPFAVAVATRHDETIASDLGLVYAVNTTGAILGALVTGFVLIPWFGLHATIKLVAAATAVGASALALTSALTGRSRLLAAAASLAVLLGAAMLPPWNPLLLSSGAYKYAASLKGPDLQAALTAGELRYYREGTVGTIAVRDLTGTRSLAIDGKVDASNSGDMLTQRMLSHLPLLLHRAPKRVAIVGLGSGVTLGSALRHPIEQATVLEISPEVVEASSFFREENHDALADPRTRLIVGDGRTHLLLTREQYEVIVSEPSNPWMAGIASLFTRDFFAAARARLTTDGILCQWAHTYDISSEDLKSIVATFLSVFPDGTLWQIGDADLLLVGSNEPLEPRLASIAEAWRRPGVAEDLASVGATLPFTVLSMFVGNGDRLAVWAGRAPIQTDDRARLEFSGPRTVFSRSADDNAEALRALARDHAQPPVIESALNSATADAWRARASMLLAADAFRPAFDDLRRAAELNPNDALTFDGLLRASAHLDQNSQTRAWLTRLASDPGSTAAKLALSRLLASEGAYDDAARIPFSLLQADPANQAALEQLASVLADAGDVERLAPVVARLRAEAPGSEAARYYTATLLFLQERPDLAASEARAIVAMNPGHARAQNLLGAALASLGQREEARAAFHASLRADPRDSATYANLGTLELQAGNRTAAAQHFASALIVDQFSDPARKGLAEAMAR
jgi:spermidine synthase